MMLPYLSLGSWIVFIVLLTIALLVVALSYWRHFHHFTYTGIFVSVNALFVAIYQIYPAEMVSYIVYTIFPVAIIIFVLDFRDFLILLKPRLDNRAKYCIHFQACPCGCGYGVCAIHGPGMKDGKKLITKCKDYQIRKNVRRKVVI